MNTTTPARILIVEDERIVALDLQRHLTHLGYTVVALAVSGVEAIQKALALRPDVVLMDIRLQGDMDGVEAAQQIQAATASPVVFMTAYVDDATQQRVRATSPYGLPAQTLYTTPDSSDAAACPFRATAWRRIRVRVESDELAGRETWR